MTLELVPFARDTDPEAFAAALAPGFGRDFFQGEHGVKAFCVVPPGRVLE